MSENERELLLTIARWLVKFHAISDDLWAMGKERDDLITAISKVEAEK